MTGLHGLGSATASAETPGAPNGRLVVVFLRGAADHLSITVPLDEPNYHDARPTIAVDPSTTLQLDDQFGFHPALARLHQRYAAGELAPVVAVGNPAADRSHFLAQDLLERGSDGQDDMGDGWLARHLRASSSGTDNPLRAITIGGNVDESLIGYPALGMGSLQTFGLALAGGAADDLERAMRQAHAGDSPADRAAVQALDAARKVADLPPSSQRNPTAAAFEDIVTLLDADLEIEAITVSIGGWDTHDRMGTVEQGEMRNLLNGLDTTLGDLSDRLDERAIDDVTTIVVTEFGRRVAENGSGGCDHGWGSTALVLGKNVAGGRVYGDWPGLSPDVVADAGGDVPMTTDYRDLLADVVDGVLGGDPSVVFPDHQHSPLGLIA
jgi:uncharacterized protein (DUF1501 family)